MDKLIVITACNGGSCCCLSPRSTIVLISVVSLVACLVDMLTSDDDSDTCCPMKEYVSSARSLLLTLFQVANLLLLLGSIIEYTILMQIYVWFTMGFVMMGLAVSVMEFLFRVKQEGVWSLITFLPEVVFLFVLFRCLPIVDAYRKHIDGKSN